MYKIIIRSILLIISILFFVIIYLSNFGIRTTKFNTLIQNKVAEIDSRLKTEIQEVRLILDLKNKEIRTNTKNTKIYLDNNLIELSEINLNIDVFSFFKERYIIKKLEIYSQKSELKNLIKLVKSYKFNFATILLENRVKQGYVTSKITLYFDEKSGKYLKYKITGKVKKARVNLLNNKTVDKINFNFEIKNKEFYFSNINFEYEAINLSSENISIIQKNKKYFVKGNLKNKKKSIKPELIKNLFNLNIGNLVNKEFVIETNNQFNLLINEKMKIKNFNVKSSLGIDKIIINYDFEKVKNYISDYNKSVILKDINIDLDYSKEKISMKGSGKYSFNKKFDNLKINLTKIKKDYKFNTEIEINNSQILLNAINYTKPKKIPSLLKIKGNYIEKKAIIFDQIFYSENKNFFKINKLKLNNNFKIIDLKKIKINYLNQDSILNNLILEKNKNKEYILSGNFLDSHRLIDDLLKEKKNKRLFRHFADLNLRLKVNIKQVFLDDYNYLKNLNGIIEFKKNEIFDVELKSLFSNKDKFLFSLKYSDKNEKVMTMYSDNAEPFVNKFQFIKGFSNGKIDFYSISKNNTSRSQIRIYDFKVKEVPALATLLSLASLQGIADIMTGEGLRFNEFEMNFKNKNNIMTIDEIYSIGPAISILMKGYVEKDRLISLRGTLVPATTINKAVGSIPILGDILVGRKTGEGVFGVSFKIKGPPKDLKTTVNPVKTLTPRFITRTLEKIKKSN